MGPILGYGINTKNTTDYYISFVYSCSYYYLLLHNFLLLLNVPTVNITGIQITLVLIQELLAHTWVVYNQLLSVITLFHTHRYQVCDAYNTHAFKGKWTATLMKNTYGVCGYHIMLKGHPLIRILLASLICHVYLLHLLGDDQIHESCLIRFIDPYFLIWRSFLTHKQRLYPDIRECLSQLSYCVNRLPKFFHIILQYIIILQHILSICRGFFSVLKYRKYSINRINQREGLPPEWSLRGITATPSQIIIITTKLSYQPSGIDTMALSDKKHD
ncbi:hypothetical protein BDB01DRAFT_837447 [Pilobolus umbonatus]|nr:hypothetical protein BDB01DRAFT_837447 [Pilobolus umbonatus]